MHSTPEDSQTTHQVVAECSEANNLDNGSLILSVCIIYVDICCKLIATLNGLCIDCYSGVLMHGKSISRHAENKL